MFHDSTKCASHFSAVTVSFDNPSYNVNEASRSVQLTVVFSQPTLQRFSITASTMDGTATGSCVNYVCLESLNLQLVILAPQDYTSTSSTFFIPLASNLFRFSIIIDDDQILEQHEQFSVLLQLPTDGLPCGITLGSVDVATVNIEDNDGT